MSTEVADLFRALILVLYGLTVGQILWIIRRYAKAAQRLLPRHITIVGVAYLLALSETAWQNAGRVGDPATLYIPTNLVVMALSLYAMDNMRRHLTRRYRASSP